MPAYSLAVRTFASGLTRLALSPSRTHSAVRTFASKAKTERADTACVSTAARTPGGPISRRCRYRFHQQACGNIEIQETTTPHQYRATQGSYGIRPPRSLVPPLPSNGNRRCPEADLICAHLFRSLLTDKPQQVPNARWRYRAPPASWLPIGRITNLGLTYMSGRKQLSSQVQAWPGQGSYRTCCAPRGPSPNCRVEILQR